MWAVSDDALLAGLAACDPDAAEAFVARFQRRVYGVAWAVVRDDQIAEDVAQEAFARAWRHASAFDPRRGSVATWLLTITRNLAIDSLRVRRPLSVDPDDLLGFDNPSAAREPQEAAILSDDVVRLQEALRALPPEQRRAVVLAGLLGYTAREVGDMEGVPLGTAKTRIRTALLRLRAVLVTEDAEG